MNLAFVLSLYLSQIKDLEARRWFSTFFGIVLGFNVHGFSYWVSVAAITAPYVCMVVFQEDRKRARNWGIAIVTVIMAIRNFVPWWDSIVV